MKYFHKSGVSEFRYSKRVLTSSPLEAPTTFFSKNDLLIRSLASNPLFDKTHRLLSKLIQERNFRFTLPHSLDSQRDIRVQLGDLLKAGDSCWILWVCASAERIGEGFEGGVGEDG